MQILTAFFDNHCSLDESLQVWEVRVDIHVLDHCGNILDCAAIASITALKHFRYSSVQT